MSSWKDFLYYSKTDRIAIILLFILIIITGIISIYLRGFSAVDLSYYSQKDSIQKEFIKFEQNLSEAYIITEDSILETKPISKTNDISKKLDIGYTLDINSASASALTRIPGIGKTYAERIIEYRTTVVR